MEGQMILELQGKRVFEESRFEGLELGDTVKLISWEVFKE